MNPPQDHDASRAEHLAIFGHLPLPDLRTGQCAHPMHGALQQLIDAPGVDIEIPFDFHAVHTEDDEVVYRFNTSYADKVDFYRQWIAAEEEKIAHEQRGERQVF